jgi:uncharacterized protein involved in exopolysaccharide biosynthesis
MVQKDCKNLSNNELKLYKLSLENEYEAIKAKIASLEEQLDKLDREYEKAENEEKIRRTAY